MSRRILCVDDEPNLLQALERQFRRQFEIRTAVGPELGLQAIAEAGPFAVVVSDLQMPVMDGNHFLARVREVSPDTVRVLLTGHADLGDAIAAVNEGHIFQFLTKPCPSHVLARTLETALEQYRLITAEREILEQTLHGAISMMSEILSLVNPPAFSRANRITRYVRHIARKLALPDPWQYEIAAMLSQIGCVTVPPEILDKFSSAQPLTPEEAAILASQSQVGRNLLAKIPRLGDVAAMIANQGAAWNRAPGPERSATGAHLLKVASDFDELVMCGGDVDSILAEMRDRKTYSPAFMDALEEVQLEESLSEMRLLKLAQLRTRMVIHRDVRSKSGLLLLAQGQEVTDSAIARLKSFALTTGIVEPISVMLPHVRSPREEETAPANAIEHVQNLDTLLVKAHT
jgi:response regulator RpfG family c-di-GMP phosphodiesterase